jgi:hypothetical protein
MRLTTPFTPIVLALLWTAPALAAEDEPKKASASLAASLEFQLGLSNTVEDEVDGAPAVEDCLQQAMLRREPLSLHEIQLQGANCIPHPADDLAVASLRHIPRKTLEIVVHAQVVHTTSLS